MEKSAQIIDELKNIPQEISLSKLEWIDSEPYKRENPTMVKPEKDINDEIALKTDFR